MVQTLFVVLLALITTFSHAHIDCLKLNDHVLKQGNQIAPVWILSAKSKQRVYFHSAPHDACKIKDLFIIQNDIVSGYHFYREPSEQDWIYVLYYSKRKDLDNEIVEGWIKFKNLKNIPREFP